VTDVTPPALSVSDTVRDAFCEAQHRLWMSRPDARTDGELEAGLAAAIAQWVRETIAAKSDYEVERLATMMEFLEGHGDARLHLLTFMGVPNE
jgi:hypothetical protein